MATKVKAPMWLRIVIVIAIGLVVVLKMAGVISSESTSDDQGENPGDEAPLLVTGEQKNDGSRDTPNIRSTVVLIDDGGIALLFENERSGVHVHTSGVVVKLLPDDNEGSRHQRFLVELDSGITIKIAHNIDLAPRVPCEEGDTIEFYGVYEWSDLGGTVHWTHHDPGGRHTDGWIEHGGKRYE